MTSRTENLFDAFVAGRVGRRELFRRAAALGLTVGAAEALLNAASTRAIAADYDWMAQKGQSVKLLLNKHPYADAMIADIENFKKLTGLDVSYDIFPEDVYFDKVTAALSSKSTEYDAFMTGAYQTWQYGPAGWLVDLNEYIKDSSKTAANYDWGGRAPRSARIHRMVRQAGRRARRTRARISGAFPGASKPTTSPTTRRSWTRSASRSRRTSRRWSRPPPRSPVTPAAHTASASAAAAPGRPSTLASSPATPTTAPKTSPWRAASCAPP